MPQHLLGIEKLTREQIYRFIENARSFVEVSERSLKKVPPLRGKTVINLFLEPSTRTRTSFEIAAKRLSADTVNIGGSDSSVLKGETLLDTVQTLQAMSPDILVMRHRESGAPNLVARYLKNTSVVNAGDGLHEHPTQALLDCLTLVRHFKERSDGIENLRVAIVGDVRHSRVARSNIWAHLKLGNHVTLVGPPTLVPPEYGDKALFGEGVSVEHDLRRGLQGADVVMCLRMQLERQTQHFVPNLEEYSKQYCVTERLLDELAPDCVVLHPGPANRGLEVSSGVLDSARSLFRQQVNHGVAIRMAVLFQLSAGAASESSARDSEAETDEINISLGESS
ncbi:MAG: aspartate carbamoyltransferase catalytic subunit [Bdellovibrionales bacterium]|nr:aspartate carbamoyltransferase catalytic subunit [Bdellovibrionales bacterium]